MGCLERLTRRRALLGATSVAASLAALCAPAYGAGDGVPRPPGAIDNRGYELVNIPDKNEQIAANPVLAPNGDNNRLLYTVGGGSPISVNGTPGLAEAIRTPTGWESRMRLPQADELVGTVYGIGAVTPDLSTILAAPFDEGGSKQLAPSYVKLFGDRQQTILHRFPTSFGNVRDIVATDDLAHLYVNVEDYIGGDPDHQPGTNNVYDFGSGTPRLVSKLPGGSVPACGVPSGSYSGFPTGAIQTRAGQNWLSRDGRYLFFISQGDACGPFDPLNLYRIDLRAGTTSLISGPTATSFFFDYGTERILQAAADGSWIIYRTYSALDADDPDEGIDIYRWDEGRGNKCLSCAALRASSVRYSSPLLAPDVWDGDLGGGASYDGSRVYFTSKSNALDPGKVGPVADYSLYLIEGGELRYVAPAPFGHDRAGNGQMTADGSVIYFVASDAWMNTATGTDNNGTAQWYRYDTPRDRLTCVSCLSGGAPSTADVVKAELQSGPMFSDASAITADGGTFIFVSKDTLVGEDTNDSTDIYEWHDGRLGLITDGRLIRNDRLTPLLIGVTADGSDVFFRDFTPLTTAADGGINLYTARIGGGFRPGEGRPAPCSGDTCQGATTIPPALQNPPTKDYDGPDEMGPDPVVGAVTLVKVTRAQLKSFARTGRLTLATRVNTSGKVSVTASAKIGKRTVAVARGAKAASKAGTVRIPIRLSKAARKQLRAKKKLRTAIVVSFSQASGIKRTTLVLRAPATAKRR